MSESKTHFSCFYWPIKKTVKATLHGQKWYERCKHGYYSFVDTSFNYSNQSSTVKTPLIHKTWFDPMGNVIGNTGDKSIDNAKDSTKDLNTSGISNVVS